MNEQESKRRVTRRQVLAVAAALSPAVLLRAAEKYSGPMPPKKDVPYLLHADNLVETEVASASQTSGKNDVVFSVPGETSSARTPLAEPIFLFAADRLDAGEPWPVSIRRQRRQAPDLHRQEEGERRACVSHVGKNARPGFVSD